MNDPRKLPWARLSLCFGGILTVAANWRWAVDHLYSLPPESLAAFQSITNNAQYVIGALVVFAVTGKLVWDWKNATTSTAATVASIIAERTPKAAHFDDDEIS
jgi:hypothetical protein